MNLEQIRADAERLARLLWPLEQPIVGYDLETTGLSPSHDRIIEIGAVKIAVDGTVKIWESFVNPERPLPAHIVKITGIADADLVDAPIWDQRFAGGLAAALTGCDLVGYNLKFDVQFTLGQCERVGVVWKPGRVLDPFVLWGKLDPRTLSHATERWLKRPHDGAHRAGGDVGAAMAVLAAQLEEYPNLPRTAAGLHAELFPRDPNWIDEEGKFIWLNGEPHLNFGKHRGPMRLVDSSYWRWMVGAAFPDDVKAIARAALEGRLPSRPGAAPAADEDSPF